MYLIILALLIVPLHSVEVMRMPCYISDCDLVKVISPSKKNAAYPDLLKDWIESTRNQLELGCNGQSVDVKIDDIIIFVRHLPLLRAKLNVLETTYDKMPAIKLIDDNYAEIKKLLQSALAIIRTNIDTDKHSGFTAIVEAENRKYMYRGLSQNEYAQVIGSLDSQYKLIQENRIEELATLILPPQSEDSSDRDTFMRNQPERILNALRDFRNDTIFYIADGRRIEIVPGSINGNPTFEYLIYLLQDNGTLRFGQIRHNMWSNKSVK
jgi:hypothetical protein